MGSFDMTCGVSNLTVAYRTPKVKLFFIAENTMDNDSLSKIYPWDRYSLASYAMNATYDDYGKYEIDEDQEAWKGFLNFIKTQAVNIPVGENQYHDIAFDPKNPEHLTSDYIQEAISEGRLMVKDYRDRPVKIGVFPVLVEIWDDLVLLGKKSWRDEVLTYDNFKREAIEKLNDKSGFSRFDMDMPIGQFASRYDVYFHKDNDTIDWYAGAMAEVRMLFATLSQAKQEIRPSMYGGQDPMYKENMIFHAVCASVAQKCENKYNEEW